MSNRRLSFRATRSSALLACLALIGTTPAPAQLALPGAAAPTAEGTVVAPSEGDKSHGAKPKPKRRAGNPDEEAAAGPAVAPKPPTEDGVLNKPLTLDGSRSVIELQRLDGKVLVSRLILTGDSISRSGESCRVEVAGMPMRLQPREDDSGLHRYQADFPACPFVLQVLEGAILVGNEAGACEIKAADCRSDPRGLWGESEFDPKRAKEMLGLRARVEKTVRADFRALYEKYKKDKVMRQFLVQAQAGFSARREDICHAYAMEEDVGYCALRVTEARALTLGTQLAHGVTRPSAPPPDQQPAQPQLKRVGR